MHVSVVPRRFGDGSAIGTLLICQVEFISLQVYCKFTVNHYYELDSFNLDKLNFDRNF